MYTWKDWAVVCFWLEKGLWTCVENETNVTYDHPRLYSPHSHGHMVLRLPYHLYNVLISTALARLAPMALCPNRGPVRKHLPYPPTREPIPDSPYCVEPPPLRPHMHTTQHPQTHSHPTDPSYSSTTVSHPPPPLLPSHTETPQPASPSSPFPPLTPSAPHAGYSRRHLFSSFSFVRTVEEEGVGGREGGLSGWLVW